MWTIASAIYFACKWITWRRAPRSLGWLRSIGYLFLWPGMDPKPFLSPALPADPRASEWLRAARNTAAGAALTIVAASLSHRIQTLWVGWLGMIGIVLFLHFGIFECLARVWNNIGIPVKPVMQKPLHATSLADFWGRRWNTAFNDLAHALAFRPLTALFEQRSRRRSAIACATLAVFALSGLLHELVISLPARAGYGLPTGYFIFQGLAALFERSPFGRRIGLGHGLRGWLFTAICAAGPAFWLFHPAFVRNVILPMLQTLGGN
jgi:alginate O-acetyltransferase complex protein AlgI